MIEILNTILESELSPRKKAEQILDNYCLFLKKQKLNLITSVPSDKNDLEKSRFYQKVEEALLELTEDERLLLQYRYLENGGNTFDYIVKDKLGISERTYYRIKASALLNLYKLLF